jgi:NACalpha-BTF3-like transcription factor
MTPFNRRAQIILLGSALTAWAVPGVAQAPERLSDNDVKLLIDQVDEGRDKFEGNLDGKFKAATLRGPAGEARVSAVLQDYQDNTQKLKDRFTPDYSASTEVTTVLKQSTTMNTFMEGAESSMKGRSEWDRQVGTLKRLAGAYGTTFPLPDGATVRRMNDKEAAAAAEGIATAAGRFKNDVDKDKTLAKPDKDAAKKDVELLIKQAGAAKSRISDGKPATSEVHQLVEQVARLQTFVGAHPIPTMTNWQAVQASLAKLQRAFGPTK